jgi:L-lactate dehydrogenase complex protein LldF
VYRVFRWAATRLRALTPSKQMGWTQHRTPLKPAARSLADLLRARDQAE